MLVSSIVSDLSLLFDDVFVCLPFCWCPCLAINVSVQYDGGFLPDIIILLLSMLISDSRLIWFGSVYLVTTAGFVADQLM